VNRYVWRVVLIAASQLILLLLKMTGAVDWSWWVIAAPLVVLVALFIFVAIMAVISYYAPGNDSDRGPDQH